MRWMFEATMLFGLALGTDGIHLGAPLRDANYWVLP